MKALHRAGLTQVRQFDGLAASGATLPVLYRWDGDRGADLGQHLAQEDAQFQKALSTPDVLNDLKKLEQLMSTPQFVHCELQGR